MSGVGSTDGLVTLLVVVALLLAWPPSPTLAGVPGRSVPSRRRRASRPVLAAAISALATTLLIGGVAGAVIGVPVAVAVLVAVGRLEPAAARRRREAIEDELPLVVDLLASCLAAGQSPGVALGEVASVLGGPVHEEVAEIAARLRLGSDPVAVWSAVARHPQLGSWGRAMFRAVDSGASVAEAMAAHADDLRAQQRARVEARARAVGVRAALPLGLCLLPAFVLLGVVPLVIGSLTVLRLP